MPMFGRAFLDLMRKARVTCLWLWGVHLQFAPPVLWLSPERRRAVAAVERTLAEERHIRQTCDEAARDALHAELSEAVAGLHLAPAPRRRPRAAPRPPNRPN
ncbi:MULTISPECIES: hypothetical protein [unclassified Kitasatospora]|uniref:hypothetical protein n=1 Tax=unclassified Kitasatospora TaxID=2633591 RepID=UPI00382FC213